MRLLYPEFIFLMLIPSLILLYLILTNKNEIERIFKPEIFEKLKIDASVSKKAKIAILFMALFFMIVAISRPVIKNGYEEYQKNSDTVVIALDISRSMLAEDVYPNRLEFSKNKILRLLDMLKGDEVAVVAFSKDSFLVSPPTSDIKALKYLVSRLDTKSITSEGTDFVTAIETINSLLVDKNEKKAVIFTDGGDQEEFSKELELCEKAGLKIWIDLVGSFKGVPIKSDNGLLKDKDGKIVITRANRLIEKIAQKSGGGLFISGYSKDDIVKIYNETFKNGAGGGKTVKVPKMQELYYYPLGIALFLLFTAFFSFPSKKVSIVLFLSLFSAGLESKAGILDFDYIKRAKESYERKDFEKSIKYFKKIAESKHSAQSLYDLANACYKAKKYDEAIRYYNMVETKDLELERFKLYNLGNCYFQKGDFPKAIYFYEKSLQIKDDEDARYNLMLAKKMMEKHKKSKKENKKSAKEQKKRKSFETKNSEKKKKEEKKSMQKRNRSKKNSDGFENTAILSGMEEKKWIEEIQKNQMPALLYPLKSGKKEKSDEKPW
ncbi:VWA domain-containing protein [Nitrosophilus alvini]|uniref:VWA domain-containing protein n=1 Tax=Nitrosophilus alvini TaxID=2714855 RepID=UPI00190AFB0E|nr:VWA domain-containing protein [Nitrosophilus alvini]